MRWGVPVAAIAVVGAAVGAGPVIAAVQGDPSLPDRTAEQLLAEVAKAAHDRQPPAMSGTLVETASLGLPSLPIPGGTSSSPLSLLSGSHTIRVWYGGDGRVRLALPGQMSETDFISTGKGEAWVWESTSNTATRFKLPAGAKATGLETAHSALPTATTPNELAAHALKAAETNTAVTVENGQHIAGRAAYQLVLTPKDSSSLVKEVKLALDGETYVPLRVQVFAKGAAEPAFEVGFTQVTFSAPAPENFAFTPPAGAKVEEKTIGAAGKDSHELGADHGPLAKEADKPRMSGSGWGTIVQMPFSIDDLAKQEAGRENGRGGDPAQMVNSLLKSAKQVSGPWGSGRVVQSKLVSALLTDDGRLLVGAVTPEALAEAAGHK
ncbi:sigma-E factor regulatory protein RseB domain-containing protein [Sphaerisporangium flaviroseum]|uniref:Sigma-E factor regulatory protein RseB domain-containing protein n=1 Tax=Sphaerisporangium flaviroseum TaxID=509199 RepID=A0ABP7HTV7_9ACTN